jgi:hypothetical protein
VVELGEFCVELMRNGVPVLRGVDIGITGQRDRFGREGGSVVTEPHDDATSVPTLVGCEVGKNVGHDIGMPLTFRGEPEILRQSLGQKPSVLR